jgi:hypothetical protein
VQSAGLWSSVPLSETVQNGGTHGHKIGNAPNILHMRDTIRWQLPGGIHPGAYFIQLVGNGGVASLQMVVTK